MLFQLRLDLVQLPQQRRWVERLVLPHKALLERFGHLLWRCFLHPLVGSSSLVVTLLDPGPGCARALFAGQLDRGLEKVDVLP